MKTNRVKERLREGEAVVGAMLASHSSATVEILGHAGCDFVILDAEHGPLSVPAIEDMTRAAEYVGMTPLVRLDSAAPSNILRILDAGVMGVQVPHIRNREEAEAAVRAVKFAPLGNRGLAGSVRAAGYASMSSSQFVEDSNANTLVIVQIEDIEILPQLDSVLDVEGIDIVFLGRNDLCHSMGLTGQPTHPKVEEVVDKIMSASLERGVAVAVSTDVKNAKGWLDRGAKFISLSFGPTMLKVWKGMVAEIRAGD